MRKVLENYCYEHGYQLMAEIVVTNKCAQAACLDVSNCSVVVTCRPKRNAGGYNYSTKKDIALWNSLFNNHSLK